MEIKQPSSGGATGDFVPYTGATGDVNLGVNDLIANAISTDSQPLGFKVIEYTLTIDDEDMDIYFGELGFLDFSGSVISITNSVKTAGDTFYQPSSVNIFHSTGGLTIGPTHGYMDGDVIRLLLIYKK